MMTDDRLTMAEFADLIDEVKTLEQARDTSRRKWFRTQELAAEVWEWMNHFCGFCKYSAVKKSQERGLFCDDCPVTEFCQRVQKRSGEISDQLDEHIREVLDFLDTVNVSEEAD